MPQKSEYAEKLKQFADEVGGTFHYQNQVRTSMKRVGWSRIDISIPVENKTVYYMAFSGNNTAEVYSGFFASTNLPKGTTCKINRKDVLDKINKIFNRSYVKTNQPGFDKLFAVRATNTSTVKLLTGKKSIRRFFESSLTPPLIFEITDNTKGYISEEYEGSSLVALRTNEWLVDKKQLNILLEGFKLIINAL